MCWFIFFYLLVLFFFEDLEYRRLIEDVEMLFIGEEIVREILSIWDLNLDGIMGK